MSLEPNFFHEILPNLQRKIREGLPTQTQSHQLKGGRPVLVITTLEDLQAMTLGCPSMICVTALSKKSVYMQIWCII